MANYRIVKMTIGPSSSVVNPKEVKVELQDTDTGNTVSASFMTTAAAVKTIAGLQGAVCTNLNSVYTPNNFGCS